jgi:hypothetical protein
VVSAGVTSRDEVMLAMFGKLWGRSLHKPLSRYAGLDLCSMASSWNDDGGRHLLHPSQPQASTCIISGTVSLYP